MADKSKIQWCDATINPAYGCSPVSPACDHCYAARMAGRLGELTQGTHQDGKWTGRINLFPERMMQALKWREPRRIFIGSMTDLFHGRMPWGFLEEVFAFMRRAQQHTFLLLTKRAENMRSFMKNLAYAHHCGARGLAGWEWPPRNVWLGVTAENQAMADERIPILLDTPAANRFVSIEPMLGAVDLRPWLPGPCQHPDCSDGSIPVGNDGGRPCPWCQCGPLDRLDWTIVGGESGPNARPMHPDWARGLRDQCQAAGVPYFFKQWGEWGPARAAGIYPGTRRLDYTDGTCMLRVGKHAAGRLLDGVEHNAFPEVRHG